MLPAVLVQDVQWIEFFSGRARATLAQRAAGYVSARLDIEYFGGSRNNYYDILTDAGMACLSFIMWLHACVQLCAYPCAAKH